MKYVSDFFFKSEVCKTLDILTHLTQLIYFITIILRVAEAVSVSIW